MGPMHTAAAHLPYRHVKEHGLLRILRAPWVHRQRVAHVHLTEALVVGGAAHELEAWAMPHPAVVELPAVVHEEGDRRRHHKLTGEWLCVVECSKEWDARVSKRVLPFAYC